MNQFSSNTDWNHVREVINKHLEEAAKELGITSKGFNSRISFTDQSFTGKIEFFAIQQSVNGNQKSIEELEWEKNRSHLPLYNLKFEDYGKKFKLPSGEIFTICGINPRKYKMPIIAKLADGRRFKFAPRNFEFVN